MPCVYRSHTHAYTYTHLLRRSMWMAAGWMATTKKTVVWRERRSLSALVYECVLCWYVRLTSVTFCVLNSSISRLIASSVWSRVFFAYSLPYIYYVILFSSFLFLPVKWLCCLCLLLSFSRLLLSTSTQNRHAHTHRVIQLVKEKKWIDVVCVLSVLMAVGEHTNSYGLGCMRKCMLGNQTVWKK